MAEEPICRLCVPSEPTAEYANVKPDIMAGMACEASTSVCNYQAQVRQKLDVLHIFDSIIFALDHLSLLTLHYPTRLKHQCK